jgi:UDP-3-O-[3-hydroxymyristoyl] glucosamine N-acyltransferase
LELTLSEIAVHVGGKVVGNHDCPISGVSEIQNSRPGTITFLANPLYAKYLSKTNADAVFVIDGTLLDGKNGIVVQNPQLAMAQTLALFFPDLESKPSIDPSATIAPTATIGNHVSIGPGTVIQMGVSIGDGSKIGANTVIGDNTTLGPNCTLHPNVSVYAQTTIGNNVIIHSGTSIGCDGYGYVTMDGVHEKIPQTGNVIIGNDVEIGSNCAIDRATIGSTSIGQMTKIDNLVHIAHNVKIGKGCLLTAGFAVAGSSEIGNYCTFAGQVGVAPHLNIGDYSIVAAKSGITKSLKGGKVYAGFPAREIKEHNKREALINEIGKLRQNLDQLIKSGSDK